MKLYPGVLWDMQVKSKCLPIVLPETMKSPIIGRLIFSPQNQSSYLVCKFLFYWVELLSVDLVRFFHRKENEKYFKPLQEWGWRSRLNYCMFWDHINTRVGSEVRELVLLCFISINDRKMRTMWRQHLRNGSHGILPTLWERNCCFSDHKTMCEPELGQGHCF